jgi:hypothetical protein
MRKAHDAQTSRLLGKTFLDWRERESQRAANKRLKPKPLPRAAIDPDDVAGRFMARIPKTMVPMTASICGDPPPGRSALDRRIVGNEPSND